MMSCEQKPRSDMRHAVVVNRRFTLMIRKFQRDAKLSARTPLHLDTHENMAAAAGIELAT